MCVCVCVYYKNKYELKIGLIPPVETKGRDLPSLPFCQNIYFRKYQNMYSLELSKPFVSFTIQEHLS